MLRWYLKKFARYGAALASRAANAFNVVDQDSNAVRVLTYHRFGNERRDPFCVDQDRFEAQMALLAQQNRAISLHDLINFVTGKASLAKNACLVTIDDGMLSTLSTASPILHKYRIPAVAFVSSGLVGSHANTLGERYLDWAELRELTGTGLIALGSHAHTHRSLGQMPIEEAIREIADSKKMLEDRLESTVSSFAYPFGVKSHFNSATDKALNSAGYQIAFNSVHGAITPHMNAPSLPRVKIEGGESLALFEQICNGALDIWKHVDRNL